MKPLTASIVFILAAAACFFLVPFATIGSVSGADFAFLGVGFYLLSKATK